MLGGEGVLGCPPASGSHLDIGCSPETHWTSMSVVGARDRQLEMSLVLWAPWTGPGRVTRPHRPPSLPRPPPAEEPKPRLRGSGATFPGESMGKPRRSGRGV